MKIRILKYFYFFVLFTALKISLFSQVFPKGTELCQQVFDFLDSEGFYPRTQSLLSSQNNDFPYNIYIDFKSEKAQNSNLLVVFEMEDVLQNKELLKAYLIFLENTTEGSNTTVLFAYGENNSLSQNVKTYGTEIFIDNLFTNEKYTALYIKLSDKLNHIEVSSNKQISPGRLIKASYNSYLKHKLPIKHNFTCLSQLYLVANPTDRNLQTLFGYGIPAIKLCFAKDSPKSAVKGILEEVSENVFKSRYWDSWEQHFILVNVFNQYKILNEPTILLFLIIIIALILIFIFVFGYINSFIKAVAWKNIRFIWYAAPLTALITIFGFFIGKRLFFLFSPKTDYSKIYLLIWLQINSALILVSLFYTVLAHFNYKFTERSIDYLILLSTFINQSIFSCIDISLFPLFLVIFVAAFFTIIFRRFVSHIYIFVLLALLSVPYAHNFLEITQSHFALNFLLTSSLWIIVVAMFLTPLFLLFFRVLIKFRESFGEGKTNDVKLAGFSLGYIALIMGAISTICLVRIPQRNKAVSDSNDGRMIYTSQENTIKIESKDTNIFDDLIRTVSIDTGKSVEICNVSIHGTTSQPVLYSDYDFEAVNDVSSVFRVPYEPPQKLSFSYGSSKEDGFIKVTIIYTKENSDEFYLEEKVLALKGYGGEK